MISLFRVEGKCLCASILLLLCAGCSEDPDNAMDPVSQMLEIPESARLTSAFPQASGDPSAPVLKPDSDTIYAIAGTYTNIFVSLTSGDPVGFNVQVKGAADYFHVTAKDAFVEWPFTALGFAITVDENAAPKPFTIVYNAYDASDRVGNSVERTVIVSELAGKNSEFLSDKSWAMVREVWGSEPSTETITIGEDKTVEFTLPGECDGVPTPVKAFQITRRDYEYYTFSEGGVFDMEIKSYNQLLDGLNEDGCSPKYSIDEGVDNYHGIWSYYSDTRTLILRYKQENVANVERQLFRVSHQDGILTLVLLQYSVPATFELE